MLEVPDSPLLYSTPPTGSGAVTLHEVRILLVRRHFIAAALATAAQPLVSAQAQDAEPLPDMVLGDPAAPIEIIEYASMTCPHCAAFHANTLPELKAQYIDTGQAKLVFREFPLDRLALMAAAVARCSGPEHYFGFISVLFETQATWARAEDPVGEIKKIVRMGSLDPAMVDACIDDEAVVDGIIAKRLEGEQTYQIQSTPSFVIDGELHSGDLTFEEIDVLLQAAEGNG